MRSLKKLVSPIGTFINTKLFLVLVIGVLLSYTFISWQGEKEEKFDQLRYETQSAALIIARNTEISFQGLSQALDRLALTTIHSDSIDQRAWREKAKRYQETYTGIRTIELLDEKMKVLTSFPNQEWQKAHEQELTASQIVSVVSPVYDGTQLEGFIIGRIDMYDVMHNSFDEYDDLFQIQLLKNEALLLETGDWNRAGIPYQKIEKISLNEFNTMSVVLAPTEAFEKKNQESVRALLLFLIFTTLIVSFVIGLAQKNHALSALNLRQYLELLENIKLAAMTVDIRGNLTYCNDHLLELLGYEQKETLGANIFELLLPYYGDSLKRGFLRHLKAGDIPTHNEVRIKTKEGVERYMVLNNTLLRNTQGEVVGFASIGDDITEQKRSDQTLFLQSSALSSAVEGIVIQKISGEIEWVNKALLELIGYEESEVIGNSFKNLIRSDHKDEDFYEAIDRTVHAGLVWSGELVNRRKDGSLYHEYMTITPVKDEFDEISHYISIKRDITEQKKLEEENRILAEQFALSQRIDSLGKLAGGIAHDFNNLLVPIIGFADIGMMNETADKSIQESFRQIKDAGEKAAELTKQILAFGRKQMLKLEVLDMNKVISDFQPMLVRLIGEQVLISFELDERELLIEADKGQLEQIIMNLAVNARDAMVKGGELTITTRVESLDIGEHAVLLFKDTGAGMASDTLEHLFEPFYTTKPQGSGTGLGLSTVFGIVKQHNGTIEVSSTLNQGSEFIISFGLVGGRQVPTKKHTKSIGKAANGSETIVVVEDNTQVLQLVSTTLRNHGYTVITCDTPKKGLAAVLESPSSIDLVLSDIIMPQYDGLTLLGKIRKQRPKTKGLFMSGYTDTEISKHMQMDDDFNFIQKPFSTDALLAKVRWVLTRP